MFSELVQGSCSWDGSLSVEKGLCSYPAARSSVGPRSHHQTRSVSSSAVLTRCRSVLSSSTNTQPEPMLSELVLPKTYMTKTGLLLLFAVIDDELFALVDSSNQGKKGHSRKAFFGENAELLSEFKSLEHFVLSVLEYRHAKEKNLYASANKKLFQFRYRSKYQYRSVRCKQYREGVTKQLYKEEVGPKKNFANEDAADKSVAQITMATGTAATVGGSTLEDSSASEGEREPDGTEIQGFERLALPSNDVTRTKGRLRSPMQERKAPAVQNENEQRPSKEYFMISSRFHRQQHGQIRSGRTPVRTSRAMASNPHIKHIEREFLYSVRGLSTDNNAVPPSLKNLIQTFNEEQHKMTSDYEVIHNKGEQLRAGSVSSDGASNVLPFMFDQESGAPRHTSASPRTQQPRFSDLINSKKHPRTASPRQAREKRALGVTPSAISLSSEEFARLIEVRATNAFSFNFPEEYRMEDIRSFSSMAISDQMAGGEPVPMLNSHLQSIERQLGYAGMQERSLGQSEANHELDSDSNEDIAEKRLAGSYRSSVGSFLDEDTDDDRILFSYISPSLRKGSWNPTVSFSFEGSSGMTMEGSFSETDQSEMKSSESKGEIDLSAEFKNVKLSSRGKEFDGPLGSRHGYPQPSVDGPIACNRTVASSIDGASAPSKKQSRVESKNADINDPSVRPERHLNDSARLSRDANNNITLVESAAISRNHNNTKDGASIPPPEYYRLPFENETATHQSGQSSSSLNGEENRKSDPLMAKSESGVLSGKGSKGSIAHSTQSVGDSQQQHFAYRELSSSGTVISIRDSIPDPGQVSETVPLSRNALSTHSRSSLESFTRESTMPAVWMQQHAPKDADKGSEDRTDIQTESANNQEKRLIGNRIKTNPFSSEKNPIPADVADECLKKKPNLQKVSDPISREITQTHSFAFVEKSVFGARQLAKGNLVDAKSEIGVRSPNKKTVLLGETSTSKADSSEATYEDSLIGNQQSVLCIEKGAVASEKGPLGKTFVVEKLGETLVPQEVKEMNPVQKKGKDRKDESNKREARGPLENKDKQTVELKIDLKVTRDSSPDTSTADAEATRSEANHITKPQHLSSEGLRLDGISEGESKAEDQGLDPLKLLLQPNKMLDDAAKAKKKPTEWTSTKRNAVKAKKKRGIASRQGSISKKGNDSKNLSPVLDLPKKMETVETMIGRPSNSDNPLKPSPDTESDAIIEREITFENQLELKETTASKSVRIQNVEVKQVSEVDPERKGAYPPSRTKRGKKGAKKVTTPKEQPEDKLKYEEQMRLLHEKEVEQQKAREAAEAKQKVLEEERERYKQEEEVAKKKEDEARRRLAEAKVKAKEEREAKRLADAEKKRQLVEQRREERRQKEMEFVEKEKEAERLKHERERRAMELREQRERSKEQERLEEEQLLEKERWEEMKREEDERRQEEERIRKAQEELERLIEEREYREQLRRVAEVQEAKMREAEEQRRLKEEEEQRRIADERERLKRAEYLKLQAELERQKEAEAIADERRQMMLLKAAKRKAELLKRREENLERMFDLKCKRSSQGISRSFTFTYFVHIPRSVWEVPIGWSNKKGKGGARGKSRPISVSTSVKGPK